MCTRAWRPAGPWMPWPEQTRRRGAAPCSCHPPLTHKGLPRRRAQFAAVIQKSFGYERAWCFKASTGFTALGMRRCQEAGQGQGMLQGSQGQGINGVIHSAGTCKKAVKRFVPGCGLPVLVVLWRCECRVHDIISSNLV